MEKTRTAFQGVGNILRFNWHFYLSALGVLALILLGNTYLDASFQVYGQFLFFAVLATSLISLLVSYYVYDCAGLYELKWLDDLALGPKARIANINAGFDETSVLLKDKFEHAELIVLDFYDPTKHTEVSIKRARKAYPPFVGTISMSSAAIPIEDACMDGVFLILSAHEIRVEAERNIFFQELHRILRSKGQIIIVEHLRDLPNFLAYNIGCFHFHSKTTWLNSFQQANFRIVKTIKITAFITSFILERNGNAN